jgi:branched-chain amino acid transport system substrate-binding protein
MKKYKFLMITFISAMLLFLSVGCSRNTNSTADSNKPIKIGMPAPLSGPAASTGSDILKGMTLAMEEINKNGGVNGHKLEIVNGDVEGQEPSKVTTVVRKLISQEKVDFMVAGLVNPSLVEMDLMQKNKIPYLLYGYAQAMERVVPKNPNNYSYIHNAIPTYKKYQTEFPEYVNQLVKDGKFKPINKKVAIVKSQNEYSLYCGEGMGATFKKLGWDIVVDETIPFEKFTEFAPIIKKIRDEKPSVILYTDHTAANAATFMNSFLEDPTPSLLFLQATPSYAEFRNIMNGKQDGVFWNYAASLLGDNKTKFEEKYKNRWNETPNPYGAFVYDAMYIAADALKKAKDPFNHEEVANILNDKNYKYKGIIGTYRFDPKTHLALSGNDGIPFVTYQEKGSEHVVVSPSNLAQGEFRLPPWYEGALKKNGN